MKKVVILLFLFISTLLTAQKAVNNMLDFQPFIGDWYTTPDSAMLAKFPETKDMVGFRFEWLDPNKKILNYYEGIPDGDLKQMILGNFVAQNPRTGDIEFLGYQTRNDYLFKGTFHFLEDNKGLVRLYEVYYPHDTKFRSPKDSLKGMVKYRDVCHLIGQDTLECTVERWTEGFWKPWGNGAPFQMHRKQIPPRLIPQWVLENWETQTKGSGIWITDNSKYKSEQEPFDAYGMEWNWGIGKQNIKGRLYCIKEGKDVGTVWEFLNFWSPETQEHRMVQIGSTGMIAQGSIVLEKDGSTKSAEKFVNPAGGSFEAGHHSWFENGAMHTQSFDIVNDNWSKRRFYIWQQPEKEKIEIPEVYNKMAWLIGSWSSSFGDRSTEMRFSWAQNQRMIKYQSTYPIKEGEAEQLETEGIITYNGIKDQIIFTNTYLRKGTHLISEGHYEFKEEGSIHRLFTCHYKEGDTLPWSGGAKAPVGGKSLEFKQIWTPIDEDSFSGDFLWKKEGNWERPIKEMEEKKEIWEREKG